MKQIFLCLGFLISVFPAFANVRGKVTDKKGEPIPGTNVYWVDTSMGTVTDTNGNFEIPVHPDSKVLVISNIAFVSDTLVVNNANEVLKIQLSEVLQLSELSVVSKNPGTIKQRTAVFQTEKITADELCKAACCNLSESFETNPSVDVSYSDAATGAKQIKMLGLSGAYVQMLTENIPNLRGISAPYGLGFIPGPWMESIQEIGRAHV